MRWFCVFLINLCNQQGTPNVINLRSSVNVQPFGLSVQFLNLMSEHFKNSHQINVVFQSQLQNSVKFDLLQGIHSFLKTPVQVSEISNFTYSQTGKFSPKFGRYRKKSPPFGISYLIVAENVWNILQYIDDKNPPWRSDVRILFIILEKDKSAIYQTLFEILWTRYSIIYGILYVKDREFQHFLAFNPFITNFINQSGEIYSLLKDEEIDLSPMIDTDHINMNGYVFKASYVPFQYKYRENYIEYMDDYILKILSEYMNFTVDAAKPRITSSIEFKNGSITGSLQDIVYDNRDIIMNPKIMKVYKSIDLEYVLPVIRYGKCCVVVPKASMMPSWLSMIRFCDKEVWLSFISTCVLCTAFLYCLRTFSLEYETNKKYFKTSASIVVILNVIFPIPFSKLTSIRPLPERTLMASCMLYSIAIFNVFEGVLFNFLKNPSSHKEINTLEDILESGLPMFASDMELYDSFKSLDTEISRSLYNRFYVYDGNTHILNNIALYRNETVLITQLAAVQIMETYKRFYRHLHITDECPITYMASYLVPKGSIYLPSINNIVSRLYEGGLTDWWQDKAWDLLYLPYRFHYGKDTKKVEILKPFSLEDVFLAFIILLVGLNVGVIIFIIEFVVYKMNYSGCGIKDYGKCYRFITNET